MTAFPLPLNTNAPYIGATVPAKTVRASGTTLFRIAARQFGDALNWVQIAQINGITDPWIFGLTNVKIPPVISTAPPTGLVTITPGGATAGIAQTG